jgi:outer membrane receptor protein involved in Fe transport
VLNLGAEYLVNSDITLSLQINNLQDRRYSTAAQLGAAGFDANGNFQARAFGGSAVAGFPVQQSTFFAPGAPRSLSLTFKFKFKFTFTFDGD